MRQRFLRFLRSFGFSAAAFGLAACLPLALAQPLSHTPEPRIGEAPAGDLSADADASELHLLAAAEMELAALDAEISHLRKALDILGPLPDHPGLFIPVSMDEPTPADRARLYAIAPKLDHSRSLFHEAEFGAFPSRAAAEERWRLLVETNRLAGLAPTYADVGGDVRLTAGPLATAGDVEALCVELAAVAGPCRVAAPIRAW